MPWVKKLWFPVGATVLVAYIGFNLYTISRLSTNENVPSNGSLAKADPKRTKKSSVPADLVSGSGPRDIAFRLKPTNGESDVDAGKLTAALTALGPVEQVTFERNTVKLTIASSLKLSELAERLGFQETVILEDEFPLRGGLRLHVSGMT